jgi:protein TonB
VTPAPTAAPTPEAAPIAPPEPAPSALQSVAASAADAPAPSAAHDVQPSAAHGSPSPGEGDATASNAGRPGPGPGANETADRAAAGVGPRSPGTGSSGAGASGDGPLALAIPGDAGAGVYGPYLMALRRRLLASLEYPAAARRRGLSGTVHLEIAIDAAGRLNEVLVVRSSSHALLDDAALQAARSLRRVPFPPDVRPRALRVLMPVVFDLR